ncbi:MAG: LemA family protein [Geodermatophilaceae bacterium]|nr:LemA family protein [Geodermatophilaceae bacterium]
MSGLTLTLLLLGGTVVLIASFVLVSYNRFIAQRNLIAESWKQVDVELQRRFDLIPNLIETVKGYAAHERQVLENVTAARGAALARAQAGAGPAARQDTENAFTRAIGGLFAVAENYPNLRASENFAQLQGELANTEDRIAAGRRFYNGNVRAFNTRVESVPSNIVAGMFSFTQFEYFEIEDPQARRPVRVQF